MARRKRTASLGAALAQVDPVVTVAPPPAASGGGGITAIKAKWDALPQRTKYIVYGGGALLLGAFLFRKQIASGASVVAAKAVRALMPKGTEQIADIAFELAPKYDVSPFTILGITFAESNFGTALTPKGPGGTGDFIPRPVSKDPKVNAVRAALPGVTRKTLEDGIKSRNIPGPVEAWVPTTRGWGHGLYQLDWEAFNDYLTKSNDWADPRRAMERALKLYSDNRKKIRAAFPSLSQLDLLRATVAAYNAGAGALPSAKYPKGSGVIGALAAGVSADQLDKGAARKDGGTRVTFGQGYVDHILGKASKFSSAA